MSLSLFGKKINIFQKNDVKAIDMKKTIMYNVLSIRASDALKTTITPAVNAEGGNI